eukprot:gb/GECG01001957.1/.p1 GENE.gb/GECG01001957.1/~~gb/GECG01001957.1/.p1  ORF type:complete len:407 (+),score=29.36 gb/GECG01001957.1/:1-1221(+)
MAVAGGHQRPQTSEQSPWRMFTSRSLGKYYWTKGDKETAQWDPPVLPETVLFNGLALGCKDDSTFSLSRLSPFDRRNMWNRWAQHSGVQLNAEVQSHMPSSVSQSQTETIKFIERAFKAIRNHLDQLWDNEQGCFLLRVPRPPKLPESRWPIIPKYPQVSKKDQWTSPQLLPNNTIREIYDYRMVYTGDNNTMRVSSAICPLEGMHLYRLIYENGFKKTLEIGMACGLSALYICAALADLDKNSTATEERKHFSIDPFQTTQWASAATTQLKRAGLEQYSQHIEEYAHVAIPQLEKNGHSFDLVFVDGMHLFDYTLVDLFLADKVLRVGGLLVLDDIKHPGVADCLQYITSNYTHWHFVRTHDCSDTSGCFIKIAPDMRKWSDHAPWSGCRSTSDDMSSNKRQKLV